MSWVYSCTLILGVLIEVFRRKRQVAKEKSFGNSQVLPRDYARRDQIELVLKELSDQVATRLRNANCQTECVSIFIGYSKGQVDQRGRTGWRKQLKIACSNNTKVLTEHVLKLFEITMFLVWIFEI